MSRKIATGPEQFGLALLSRESRFPTDAYVFCSRVVEFARAQMAPWTQLLGSIIAHEVGHLLLGSNSHAGTGIMGAQWRPEEPQEIQWVRRNLLECEPDVTVEIVEQLMKHKACTHDPIHDLLRTPAIKKHLTPVARKFGLMGFDIRTKEQKAEDERRADQNRSWSIRQLASRYDREKIYEEIWSEPIQSVAKRYDISDVGLAKVCKKLKIPRPGRGYWAIKAAGKATPKRPPLPELFT